MATFVVLASLGSLAPACVQSDDTDHDDAVARLESLGDAWLRTSATINYSTVVHPAGSATSIHQCLRQMAGGAIDRQAAIRTCGGKGELTLTWDPPDRWRMDVSNAQGRAVLVSTPDGAYHCHRSETGRRRCAQISAGELESDTPFGAIFRRPTQILDELGAADSLTTRPDREIAGTTAECFAAELQARNGDSSQAGWCYSKDGILLSSLVVVPEVGTSMLEAIEVSSGVSDADFVIDEGSTDVASIAGTWEFEALTGVPPAELPPGSVPDNRHDLVIDADGSFRWGTWSGHVDASGEGFALFVVRPGRLGQRFIDDGASARVAIVGDEMRIWLPDLGRDRDVDIGAAVEDIDSPDMSFRRAD